MSLNSTRTSSFSFMACVYMSAVVQALVRSRSYLTRDTRRLGDFLNFREYGLFRLTFYSTADKPSLRFQERRRAFSFGEMSVDSSRRRKTNSNFLDCGAIYRVSCINANNNVFYSWIVKSFIENIFLLILILFSSIINFYPSNKITSMIIYFFSLLKYEMLILSNFLALSESIFFRNFSRISFILKIP